MTKKTIIRAGVVAGMLLWCAELVAACVPVGQPCPPPGGLKPGFPTAPLAGTGVSQKGAVHGSPVIADLGLTPGHKSIAFGTFGGKLWVVNYDGTVAPGFPVQLPGDIMSSPAVGDLDGDGIPDIVVGVGSTFDPSAAGGVWAYHRDGTLLWHRATSDSLPGPPDGIPDAVVSTPAVGDVDGDGYLEVVVGSFDQYVYVLDGSDGTNKPGWPRHVRDTVYSSAALADIDGDGKPEIIIGSDAHLEGSPYNTPNGGCLNVFRYDGTPLPGWPRCVDQVIGSAPSVGDIDGDGKPEIVVGTGAFWPGGSHKVYAFRCNGTQALGWPVSVDGQVASSPALADLDGDGVPEVIVTDDNSGPSGTFHVYAFKGNGTQIFQTRPKDYFGLTLSACNPLVADILGDSKPEILVPTNGEICVLSNTGVQITDNGAHLAGTFSFVTDTTLVGAAVDDMETDGQAIEIVAVSGTPFPGAINSRMYVWNPKGPSLPVPWGHSRRDPKRTGLVPGTPTCAASTRLYTLTPCRIIDTRDPVGPQGGPFLGGNSSRVVQITGGSCGVPATARAVSINLTVTQPAAPGQLRLFPGDSIPSVASTLNFAAGRTRANNAIGYLAYDQTGTLGVQNDAAGSVHFIIDVNGYFE